MPSEPQASGGMSFRALLMLGGGRSSFWAWGRRRLRGRGGIAWLGFNRLKPQERPFRRRPTVRQAIRVVLCGRNRWLWLKIKNSDSN